MSDTSDQTETALPRARSSLLRFARAIPRPLWRGLVWTFWLVFFAFGALVLTLRYAVLPHVEEYRPRLEQMLSESLRLDVRIGRIDAGWNGLRPRLALHELRIQDLQGRPALAFDRVETELDWSSLVELRPMLDRLEIRGPVLDLRRDAAGQLYVAGLPLKADAGGGNFSDWLLAQDTVIVTDAVIRWNDEQRAAPPLVLQNVNFRLENRGSRHRFGLTAEPPAAMAERLDMRGDFRGRTLSRPSEWRGEAYAQLDYADLAVWRQWVDYPIELPQGAGGVRVWAEVADERVTSMTADVALRDVQLRLRPDLPMMALAQLEGRLSGKQTAHGYEVGARQLALALGDGTRMEASDFQLRLVSAAPGRPAEGSLRADRLDVGALAQLAGYLPLNEGLRRGIEQHAPRGRLSELQLSWRGDAQGLAAYQAQGRFQNLGLTAHGLIPGFDNLSGRFDGSEAGGHLSFDGKEATLDLPAVFADPRIALDRVTGDMSWTVKGQVVDARIVQLSFQNADASGQATGSYRSDASGGPGEIDLSARLSRADGTRVWRYLPLLVSADLRAWLRGAIVAGSASDATLRLKGNLRDFPFADARKGTFQVTAKVAGATLRYAPDWPEIRAIQGSLLFHGPRMLIKADKGNVFSVGLSAVSAELPDLAASKPILMVAGDARGELRDFLRFIAMSPVAEYTHNATASMSGSGAGALKLKLALPLHQIEATGVAGEFEFLRNQVIVDPELPPLTEVAGKLQFGRGSFGISGINAVFLGGPVAIRASTDANDVVSVALQGSVTAESVRQQYPTRLLDHVTGTAAYRGSIAFRPAGAFVVVESNLQGVTSTLPDPLRKSAGDALALRYEREPLGEAKPGAPVRSLNKISLGPALTAQAVRRWDGSKALIERAALGFGESATLPDKGLALAVRTRFIDVDAWRTLLPEGGSGQVGGEAVPLQVTLRAGETVIYGRHLNDVVLSATGSGDDWSAQLASRQATGDLVWKGQGKGRLQARLKQLTLNESDAGKAAPEPPKELPGLDVIAEQFTLNKMNLGRLELNADNERGAWRIGRVAIQTPDGVATGSGRWRADSTRFDFKVDVSDVGRMLARLGYPEAVRRGTATLEGGLAWKGSPLKIDYPSLAGKLRLHATRGQFNKLEPGVGRLLGILSLQALPRRISLDFRDVFSEGFAFDSISAAAQVEQGLLTTDNLQIRGPAANVFMSGEVNLAAETQKLRVRVQPSIGDPVAVGAMIANPAVGIAALLAQKVLKDPLGQMLSYEYAITGSWDDPKVEKLRAAAVKREGPEAQSP